MFNKKCAYKQTHIEDDQAKVFEAMMMLILKQQQNITALTEEVQILKDLVKNDAL